MTDRKGLVDAIGNCDAAREGGAVKGELLRLAQEMEDAGYPFTKESYATTHDVWTWCERLRALAAQPAAQDGWRTMESAPRDGTEILAWCGKPVITYWMIRPPQDQWRLPMTVHLQPTFWQPLPPAPQGD